MRIRRKKWAANELRESSFVIDAPERCRGRWAQQFARPDQPLHVELGCGKGGFISRLAFLHPEVNYLAVDKIDNMLGLAKRAVEAAYAQKADGPDNVRLTAYEVECIGRILAPQDRVGRLYINFCNPWPRPRHRKHRLTHTAQLLCYRSFLAPDAELFFKTDDDGLFDDTLSHYLPEAGFVVEEVIRDLHAAQPPENIETEHERMFAKEGIPIKFLRARLGPLPEPAAAEIAKREAGMVIRNYYRYYRSFALCGAVAFHERPELQWIMPVKGEKGPAIAFRPRLMGPDAAQRLEALKAGIRAGEIPQRWLVVPDVPLEETVLLLEQNGFHNLAAQAAGPEPAMLLYREDFLPYPPCRDIECRRVRSREDFRAWVDTVNTALHGWEMIDGERYYRWVCDGHLRIYLGLIKGVPAATAATIQTGREASLEFVSTLREYRRQGAAACLCSAALEELFANGAAAVTLSACGGSVSLYEKLGFHRCFDNIVMQYDIPQKN